MILNVVRAVHLEFLVVHKEFHKSEVEHALEFSYLCAIQVRLIVYEVSA